MIEQQLKKRTSDEEIDDTGSFFTKEEIPALLTRQTKEGLRILPIIARACAWQGIEIIGHITQGQTPSADFVAGSAYDWHKAGDPAFNLIAEKVDAALVEDWQYIKTRWLKRK